MINQPAAAVAAGLVRLIQARSEQVLKRQIWLQVRHARFLAGRRPSPRRERLSDEHRFDHDRDRIDPQSNRAVQPDG